MSSRSGIDDHQSFEHLPLVLLLGVKRIAEVIRAATDPPGDTPPQLSSNTLDHVLLGVLSLDQQLTTIVGSGEHVIAGTPDEDLGEGLLR